MRKALRVAKQQGLRPSRNVGLGIHYRLYYHGGQPVLSVLGELEDGALGALMFDPITMDLVGQTRNESSPCDQTARTSVQSATTSDPGQTSVSSVTFDAAKGSFRHDITNVNSTAYAMGALTGGYGTIAVGDVAMHPRDVDACLDNDVDTYCVPFLPFGTRIYLTNPAKIEIPQGDGPSEYYTSFVVGDLGDLDYTYQSSAWWIDVYFGRWRRQGESCYCWGVDSSVCTYGATNSCENAQESGVRKVSYYYYDDIPED